MARGFGFLLGGALAGAGDALQKRAEDQRKQRLLELEASYGAQRDTQQHQYRLDEQALSDTNARARQDTSDSRAGERLDIEHAYRTEEDKIRDDAAARRENAREASEATDVSDYQTDDEGNLIGLTKKGKVIDTGRKATGKGKESPQSIEDDIVKRHTSIEESASGDLENQVKTRHPVVDNAAVAADLEAHGLKDRARAYRTLQQFPKGRIDMTSAAGGMRADRQDATPELPRGNSAAVPLPASLANEPDGTIVADKSGKQYEKRGNQLIPQ